ncbi:LacI family DNA-binding transcriptional regulator [Shewanella sp. 125m-1]
MTTLKDVAKVAGVSVTTVSNFINSSKSMKAETKLQIQNAIKQTGYRHNTLAASLKKKKSGIETVGIVSIVDQNPFFSELFFEVEKACNQVGISVLSSFQHSESSYDPKCFLQLMNGRVDALVVISIDGHDVMEAIKDVFAIPVISVSLNNPYSETNSGVTTFEQNAFHGGYVAGNFLALNGHNAIACFTGPKDIGVVQKRNKGLLKALDDRNCSTENVQFFYGDFTFDSGCTLMQSLFSKPEQYSAIFCHNDLIAAGAINMASKLGLRVPQDISIIGYDDIKLASFLTPKLTTIKIPLDTIAQQIITGIKTRAQNSQEVVAIEVMPELVIRDSVKPIK